LSFCFGNCKDNNNNKNNYVINIGERNLHVCVDCHTSYQRNESLWNLLKEKIDKDIERKIENYIAIKEFETETNLRLYD
jgi:hypothetical protein